MDILRASRIGVETRYICWGAGIVDLDNDGLPDLFMVTGHVYPEVERTLPQYPNKTPRAVFRNLGDGIFEELIEEAGPGVAAPHCSRGCAFGDFDNDGDIDILIINLNEPPSLLRNDLRGTTNNWIKVKLIGTKSNRSGIGARLKCVTRSPREIKPHEQIDEVRSGGSYISQNDLRIHFGLGKAEKVDLLEIRWPSGIVQTLTSVKGDRQVQIDEPGAGEKQTAAEMLKYP